jgi:hypothetical protein
VRGVGLFDHVVHVVNGDGVAFLERHNAGKLAGDGDAVPVTVQAANHLRGLRPVAGRHVGIV